MKNTLTDLNNYLFEAIERINDDGLSGEELEKEIRRSEAVQKIAKTIIDNGSRYRRRNILTSTGREGMWSSQCLGLRGINAERGGAHGEKACIHGTGKGVHGGMRPRAQLQGDTGGVRGGVWLGDHHAAGEVIHREPRAQHGEDGAV